MSYVIVTDSTCDLPAEFRAAHQDLLVIPLSYFVNGREYLDDGKGLSSAEFYDILRNKGTVTTGQVGIYSFCSKVRPCLEAGEDLLYIGMSSGISGSFQSGSCGITELEAEFPERRMMAVDSRSGSMGLGLVVTLCLERKAAGAALEETAAFARSFCADMEEWFTLDDLMYLKRGGRISAATAVVGSALGMKPILTVDAAGRLVPAGKARGREAAIRLLAGKVPALSPEETIAICHADCPEDAEKLERILREERGFAGRILIGSVGPVIGAHGGLGVLALFFRGAKQ